MVLLCDGFVLKFVAITILFFYFKKGWLRIFFFFFWKWFSFLLFCKKTDENDDMTENIVRLNFESGQILLSNEEILIFKTIALVFFFFFFFLNTNFFILNF